MCCFTLAKYDSGSEATCAPMGGGVCEEEARAQQPPTGGCLAPASSRPHPTLCNEWGRQQ
eukprot:scaffold23107_cov159-Isochrysis_galbana.AAC.3